jgi:hypothetical protein
VFAWPGEVQASVQAAVSAALSSALTPLQWGLQNNGAQSGVQWLNDGVVRISVMESVIIQVPGVHYVSAITINGSSSDVAMPGIVPLPNPGTMTITVNTMLDPVVAVVSDNQDGTLPGWAAAFDAVGNPAWLDWMGQFVGVSRPAGLSDLGMASLVLHPTGFNRGSVSAMVTAMQATLTGTKTVIINTRVGAAPFAMTVATFTSETPNSQNTLLALQNQMPAWMQFTYSTVTGGTYALLAVSHSSYTLMEAAHTHYSDILTTPGA